mmetsp:Transcript_33605/g.84013  ORF Transcript_33605/g.84013 Transcript_33605/m.84013 type:complete len:303 (+) Transcript_33605:329-1237(+)
MLRRGPRSAVCWLLRLPRRRHWRRRPCRRGRDRLDEARLAVDVVLRLQDAQAVEVCQQLLRRRRQRTKEGVVSRARCDGSDAADADPRLLLLRAHVLARRALLLSSRRPHRLLRNLAHRRLRGPNLCVTLTRRVGGRLGGLDLARFLVPGAQDERALRPAAHLRSRRVVVAASPRRGGRIRYASGGVGGLLCAAAGVRQHRRAIARLGTQEGGVGAHEAREVDGFLLPRLLQLGQRGDARLQLRLQPRLLDRLHRLHRLRRLLRCLCGLLGLLLLSAALLEILVRRRRRGGDACDRVDHLAD